MAVESTLDTRYREAARYIQEGSWKAATGILQDLLKEHPQQKDDIEPLLDHVRMKAKLEGQPVRGRTNLQLLLLNRKRLTQALVMLVVAGVLVGGWYTVTYFVGPAKEQQQRNAEIQALLQQAESFLGDANYTDAAVRFQDVLNLEREHPDALLGLQEAEEQIQLNQTYNEGLEELRGGYPEAALEIFQRILAQEPDYRDVQKRIQQIQTDRSLGILYAQAEEHFQAGRWIEAIPLYTEIRQSNVGFEALQVEQNLFLSYVNLATTLSTQSGLSQNEIDGVAGLYRQALSLQPKNRSLRVREQLLAQYMQGVLFTDNSAFRDAVRVLDGVYKADPVLLGGDVVTSLYAARLGYGSELEAQGNLWSAMAQYLAAADLPLENVGEAQLRARTVGLALTPTATPTPLPTPTPTPDPVTEVLKVLKPPIDPIENYVGWIAFRSDRPAPDGANLWVMRPDGSQQTPVYDAEGFYDHMKVQATWSNDGINRIWVESDGSEPSIAIYMWRYDVPPHWLDARVELLNNSAINYGAVYSPDNQAVAFTSQRPSGPVGEKWGDEIFIFYFDDFNSFGHVNARRLTHNDWEWDKHPTFSPDSQTIAFWSNRDTGRGQIWAMNTDGTNQRNLSNNEWNDWDPVWLMPKRELPVYEFEQNNAGQDLFDPALLNGND